MKFGQVANDRKAKSKTSMLPCTRAVGLPEAVENMRQELWIDPLTIVGDRNYNLLLLGTYRNRHCASVGCKLHCINQKVPDDLLYPFSIAGRFDLVFRECYRQIDC